MDHPVKDIPHVIRELTEGSPTEQQRALELYYRPDAAFQHPFCQVSSFSRLQIPYFGEINSRWLIWLLYRWYKILSPKITIDISSVSFDQRQQILYVSMSQVFKYFFVPFYRPNPSLVVVLHLFHDSDTNKFYIQKQEDLYQFNEWIKFSTPGGAIIIGLLQWVSTFISVLGAILLSPLTRMAEGAAAKKKLQ